MTRLSVAPLPLSNWTVPPWPIEKLCQSMTALPELWAISVVAPLVVIPAEPATILPPDGMTWAVAADASTPDAMVAASMVLRISARRADRRNAERDKQSAVIRGIIYGHFRQPGSSGT